MLAQPASRHAPPRHASMPHHAAVADVVQCARPVPGVAHGEQDEGAARRSDVGRRLHRVLVRGEARADLDAGVQVLAQQALGQVGACPRSKRGGAARQGWAGSASEGACTQVEGPALGPPHAQRAASHPCGAPPPPRRAQCGRSRRQSPRPSSSRSLRRPRAAARPKPTPAAPGPPRSTSTPKTGRPTGRDGASPAAHAAPSQPNERPRRSAGPPALPGNQRGVVSLKERRWEGRGGRRDPRGREIGDGGGGGSIFAWAGSFFLLPSIHHPHTGVAGAHPQRIGSSNSSARQRSTLCGAQKKTASARGGARRRARSSCGGEHRRGLSVERSHGVGRHVERTVPQPRLKLGVHQRGHRCHLVPQLSGKLGADRIAVHDLRVQVHRPAQGGRVARHGERPVHAEGPHP